MISIEYSILFASITSFLISYFFVPKLIIFSKKYRLADIGGRRASHKGSIPLFGGVAIFFGIILSLIFWSELKDIQFYITSFVIIFFIGIVDDLLGLSPYKKLIGQIIAVLVVIYMGELQIDSMHGVLAVYKLPDIIATIFTIFVVIVIINGFNLIDGVDGLAAGVGIISSIFFGLIAFMMNHFDMAMIAFSLTGSLLGFLRYNFHPAQIFMGDTGSLLVGMVLSVLAINLIKHGIVIEGVLSFKNKGPLLAITLLAIPLFDSLRVFIVRVRKGLHPLYPGKGHIHHALLKLGIGHARTSIVLYVISLFLILISYFLLSLNINTAIAILAVITFSILIVPFYITKD